MTALSVNINKLALLRNSRGHNNPNLLHFASRFLQLGAQGITVHPRPDQRHVRREDVPVLAALLTQFPGREFNVEGYPSADFMDMVLAAKPHQCTLVPDADNQLTSDHGWDLRRPLPWLRERVQQLQQQGIRVSLFLDPAVEQVQLAADLGVERIELYTEAYATDYGSSQQATTLAGYAEAVRTAQRLGLGVNAGHDLNLTNLASLLAVGGILEVSIGHALTIECIEQGLVSVIQKYLQICSAH